MSLKFYLFLLLVISVASHGIENNHHQHLSGGAVKIRAKRGAIWDFFQKVIVTGNLAFDQYNDTKTTLNEIYDLVSDGFSDKPSKRPRTTTTTTAVPGSEDGTTQEPTTTTEKYRITRYELGRIAGRNFRGLNRLLKIELNDALNQSHYNIQEYQREAKMVFANSIVSDTKAALKGIPISNTTMTNSTSTPA